MVAIPYWLIEYVGAVPVPVYVRTSPANGVAFTCDPWHAMKFNAKEKAEEYMRQPGRVPFESPWAAIEHEFTY